MAGSTCDIEKHVTTPKSAMSIFSLDIFSLDSRIHFQTQKAGNPKNEDACFRGFWAFRGYAT
jgi:hypothetical protein